MLDVLAPGEEPRFIYGNVSFDWPEGTTAPEFPKQNNWLVGVGERLGFGGRHIAVDDSAHGAEAVVV